MSSLPIQPLEKRSNVWDRWLVVWYSVFYGTLIFAAFVALGDLSESKHLQVIVFAVCSGLWCWFMVIRHPQWHQHPRPMLVYLVVIVVLIGCLVSLHPVFYVVLAAIIGQTLSLLPIRPAIISFGLIVVGFTSHWIITTGQSFNVGFAVFSFIGSLTLIGAILALYIDAIIEQSKSRQQFIEQLELAQRERAAAERQAGILEERQRVARELHDTITQSLISIIMLLEPAEQDSECTSGQVKLARQTAQESLADARRLVWALRPELLKNRSLPESLTHLGQQWTAVTHIPVATTITGTQRPISTEVEVSLLRVAQEALANIRKHAQATNVALTLSYMDDVVILDVQDNGQGFEVAQNNGGFGLVSIRERLQQIGGQLILESTPGEGTTLMAELPLVDVNLGSAS